MTIRVVLFSGLAGMEGHGRRYLTELARHLCADEAFQIVVAAPDVGGIGHELAGLGVEFHALRQDFGALSADRFRRYGPLAGLARGVVQFRVGRAASRSFLRDVIAPEPKGSSLVVHFLDYEYLTLAEALRSLESYASVSTVVTVHPSDFDQRRLTVASAYKNLVRWILRRRLRSVCRVICHGGWIAERLEEQFGIRGRVEPIYYPSDGENRRVDRLEARRTLGIPEHARVLLWFGMIRRNKRLDVALDALRALPDDVVLLVAGKPSDVSEEEIAGWIRDRGLDGRVMLHLGYIPEDRIPIVFSAADLLVATHDASFTSASGPVSDARTYRLPVVASDVGQIAEYVERFGVGEVASPGDPDAFAQAIRACLDDPRGGGRFAASIDRAASELSWTAFARKHAAVYRDCRS